MVMVSELALLDLKDALKLALVQSGKTPLEVAREMGWSAHHAKQVFGLNAYIPSARAFPALCRVLGNGILSDWLVASVNTLPAGGHEIGCDELMIRLNEFFVLLGEASKEGLADIADMKLEPAEIRAMILLLMKSVSHGLEMISDLRLTERKLAGQS